VQAEQILAERVLNRLVDVHKARVGAVVAAVAAFFIAGKIQLTALGRALPGNKKHGIKRIDKLLGNEAIQFHAPDFYKALCADIIGKTKRPVLLVDWSDIGSKVSALVCCVAVKGRAVVLYGEAHPRKKTPMPRLKKDFWLS
jgi:hypothetical protein